MDERVFVGDDISRGDGHTAEFVVQPCNGLVHSSDGPPMGVLRLRQSTDTRGPISGQVFTRAGI